MLPIHTRNFITGRIELVDKDELFDPDPTLSASLDSRYGSTFRIGEYTIGYTRDIEILPRIFPLRRASAPTSKLTRSPLRSSHTTAIARLAETSSYE